MCSFLILSLEMYNKIKDKNKVFKKLRMRGPDMTSIIELNGYVFIHFLLHFCGEVTDQPFHDKENDIILCYNGEIYNYKSFGNYKSDTEMIISQYIKNDLNDISNFDGEFTFVIFDFKKGKIIQSSDIFATKPQWYYTNRNEIIISSFRSSIYTCLGLEDNFPRDLNNPLIKRNIFVRDIKKLDANKIIVRKLKNLIIIKSVEVFKFDLNQHKDNFKDFDIALENAIKKRVELNNSNNNKIGLCLSSGYDSGVISCCLNKYKLDYYAYSIKCNENMDILKKRLDLIKNKNFYDLKKETYVEYKKKFQENIEVTSIKQIRAKKNTLYYYNLVGDWAGVGLYYIFSEAKKDNVKIFLSGQGADEIFSDYGWNGLDIKNMNKRKTRYKTPTSFRGKFPDDLKKIFPWANFYHSLNESFIAKEEYTGSLFGIETRYPFLDKMVVQEFLWLNKDLKNKYYKAPLHNYLEENKYPFDFNKKIGFKANYNC